MHTTCHNSVVQYITSQNTMYCGGEPEHKHVANNARTKKYVHITIINARVMNLQA